MKFEILMAFIKKLLPAHTYIKTYTVIGISVHILYILPTQFVTAVTDASRKYEVKQ